MCGFHLQVFPNDYPALGVVSAPTWSTVIQETSSGHEQRIVTRAQSKKKVVVVFDKKDNATIATIRDFIEARRGSAYAFPFKDPHDWTTAPDRVSAPTISDVTIGTGDGTTTIFQLKKVYEVAGVAPYERIITLPITSSVLVAKDGSGVTAGGNWSVSATTGAVTFTSAPANGVVVTAGFQHYTPMRFAKETEDAAQFTRDNWENNSVRFGMVEVLDETEWPDIMPSGGSVDLTMTADIQIDPSQASVYRLDVGATAYNVYLPPPGPLPGGVIFPKVIVAGSSGTLTIRNHEGTTVAAALAVGSVRTILLWNDGTNATWRAVA